jgi:hypothetical protein
MVGSVTGASVGGSGVFVGTTACVAAPGLSAIFSVVDTGSEVSAPPQATSTMAMKIKTRNFCILFSPLFLGVKHPLL